MTIATRLSAGIALAVLAACPAAGEGNPSAERRLPAFTGKSAGGETASLAPGKESLEFTLGERKRAIRAALLHFFQPDCNACVAEMKALQVLHGELAAKDVLVAGVAHRGEEAAVAAVAKEHKLSYPVLLGQGSDLAKAFSRGDATVLADAKGVVRYSQVGFKDGDAKGWKENLERLLEGKEVRPDVNPRVVLAAGDPFPDVRLPALEGGKEISLAVEDGRLTFLDAAGSATHPRAAVGFFSRY